MTTVNQLRGKAADDDSKLTSMKKDLEERELELNESITKIDMLVCSITYVLYIISIYLSFYLSIYLSIYLSTYLSHTIDVSNRRNEDNQN